VMRTIVMQNLLVFSGFV